MNPPGFNPIPIARAFTNVLQNTFLLYLLNKSARLHCISTAKNRTLSSAALCVTLCLFYLLNERRGGSNHALSAEVDTLRRNLGSLRDFLSGGALRGFGWRGLLSGRFARLGRGFLALRLSRLSSRRNQSGASAIAFRQLHSLDDRVSDLFDAILWHSREHHGITLGTLGNADTRAELASGYVRRNRILSEGEEKPVALAESAESGGNGILLIGFHVLTF